MRLAWRYPIKVRLNMHALTTHERARQTPLIPLPRAEECNYCYRSATGQSVL